MEIYGDMVMEMEMWRCGGDDDVETRGDTTRVCTGRSRKSGFLGFLFFTAVYTCIYCGVF